MAGIGVALTVFGLGMFVKTKKEEKRHCWK
jgi:hypothetical protein